MFVIYVNAYAGIALIGTVTFSRGINLESKGIKCECQKNVAGTKNEGKHTGCDG